MFGQRIGGRAGSAADRLGDARRTRRPRVPEGRGRLRGRRHRAVSSIGCGRGTADRDARDRYGSKGVDDGGGRAPVGFGDDGDDGGPRLRSARDVHPCVDRDVGAEVHDADSAPPERDSEGERAELVARPRRQPDEDLRPAVPGGRLVGRRETSGDGPARCVLGGHAQSTSGPRFPERGSGRQQHVVDDRFERARREDLVERGLGLGGRRRFGCRDERVRSSVGDGPGCRRSLRAGAGRWLARDLGDRDFSGPDGASGLGCRPAALEEAAHREQDRRSPGRRRAGSRSASGSARRRRSDAPRRGSAGAPSPVRVETCLIVYMVCITIAALSVAARPACYRRTTPAVKPVMKRRWRTRNSSRGGTIAMAMPANVSPWSVA